MTLIFKKLGTPETVRVDGVEFTILWRHFTNADFGLASTVLFMKAPTIYVGWTNPEICLSKKLVIGGSLHV